MMTKQILLQLDAEQIVAKKVATEVAMRIYVGHWDNI